ncbi:MAG: chromate transporter, partial [Firmicutes bacterium]|nr:chromate transporter [Bacillota bacterium]
PSFLLILILAAATKILHNPWLLGALHGIEVAVVGLLIDVVWTLWKDVPHVALTSALAVLALGLTLAGMNPAITIVIAAGVGWGDFMVRHQVLHGHGKLAKVSPPKTDTDDFA